jgi:inosose dehydratase
MNHRMTRRSFLASTAALPAFCPSQGLAAGKAAITVGITVDTRPDWNGPPNFIRSIDEASEIGFRWIETFWPYVARWENNPQGLKEELDKRNLKIETVSNGGGMRTDFVDPRQRAGVVEDHMKLVRFIQWFGCDHLKINIGGDAAPQAAQESAVYREMATTFSEIGKRMTDMGMIFGVHAHLNSVFETRQDIDAIMELTDPKHVHFILDTGHVSMAGMDPVKLTRDYTSRIIEYHLKDVAPENKGGYKGSPVGRLQPRAGGNQSAGQLSQQEQNLPASVRYRDRHFFELGRGGVDFPAILQVLNEANWKGWFTLELDSTVTTAKGSATVSKQYIEQILKLAL